MPIGFILFCFKYLIYSILCSVVMRRLSYFYLVVQNKLYNLLSRVVKQKGFCGVTEFILT